MRKILTVSLVLLPVIALLAVCNLEQTATTSTPQITATTSTATTPASSPSPEVKCESALGDIYSDVQLYLDAESTKPFAVIMGIVH